MKMTEAQQKKIGLAEMEEADNGVTTFILARNKRDGGEAGSRCAEVCVYIDSISLKEHEYSARQDTERRARRLCVEAWEARWGRIPWSLVFFKGAQLSVQVCYEIIVSP